MLGKPECPPGWLARTRSDCFEDTCFEDTVWRLPPAACLLDMHGVLVFGVSRQGPPAGGLRQQLHTSDRMALDRPLQSLSTSGWLFGGRLTVPITDIVRWNAWPGIVKQQAVWLADGSWLVGEVQVKNGKTVAIQSDWLHIPDIDLKSIRCILLSPPASAKQWQRMQTQISSLQGGQDCVWLSDGQRVLGVLRWPADDLNNLTQQLVLENGNQQTELELEDVQAIVFSPALFGPTTFGSAPSNALNTLGLSDGSLLRNCEIGFTATTTQLKLASGIQLESLDSSASFSSAICYIAGQPQGTSFLSQLKPADYRNLSDTKLKWQFGADRDVSGQALLIPEGFVERGIALHSSSQIAYRWDGSAARFMAEVCLAARDPWMDAPLGSVVCKVLLARDGQLQQVHELRLARPAKDQPPLEAELIDIDLSGSQLLGLVVEKADYGQVADEVFWLDARIVAPR